MSTATERRKIRNLVFKRANGQCECIHPEGNNTKSDNQCIKRIEREACHFVNKDDIRGEMINSNDVIAICDPCYFKKHYHFSPNLIPQETR